MTSNRALMVTGGSIGAAASGLTNPENDMTDDVDPILGQAPVRPRRLPEIDEFQRVEGLPSRADALGTV